MIHEAGHRGGMTSIPVSPAMPLTLPQASLQDSSLNPPGRGGLVQNLACL